ncbi:MAG: hypothetical protein AAFZ80_10155 [Cyanobacteria bacterium P01_A01_bin.105]
MRKLAVSVVTLTSLTACTQGDELGSNWSFEMPDNTISGDEQFARFAQPVEGSDLTIVEPTLPELEPGFVGETGAMPAANNAGELELPRSNVPAPSALEPNAPSALRSDFSGGNSDLSIDELVEFTYPRRGPRPNPLARVRFSPTGPQASNHYIERIMGAANVSRQSRPVKVSQAMPAAVPVSAPEPAYFRPQPSQSDLGGASVTASAAVINREAGAPRSLSSFEQLPWPPAST